MVTKDIPAGSEFESGDTAPVVRTKLNSNLAWAESQMQGIEDRLELTSLELFNKGVISGCEVSAGEGLSVDIGAGTALIQFRVTVTEKTGEACAPNATNYVFLKQDNTVEINTTGDLPTDQASVLLATAETDEESVISVDNSPEGKPYVTLQGCKYVGAEAYEVGGTPGASGTFTSSDGKTVTVVSGIVTGIE